VTTHLREYANAFENVVLEREDGILLVRLHTDGGPLSWSESVHRELPHALYAIGADPENRVVILTGTGDSFCAAVDFASFGDLRQPDEMDRNFREAKQLLSRLLDVDVPVVGAVNGPVRIHAELPLLSDIVLASDTALFQDGVHFQTGGVPGDGVHTLWPLWLGPNRARYFLLTGQEIDAEEALSLGLVGEVLAPDKLLERAWEVARRLAERPRLTLRFTRLALTLGLRRAVQAELGEGMALESLARSNLIETYPPLRSEGLGGDATG
jgi:enoyl-CoA hydratase/carnithine racemase